MDQLRLDEGTLNPTCPYRARLEDDDIHCYNHGMQPEGYEVISEDHPEHDLWHARVRGIGLNDVVALEQQIPELPQFIPNVYRGAGELFTRFAPEYVGVLLPKLVSPIKLSVPDTTIQACLGVPSKTKVILFGYGPDRLIENLWPRQDEVFAQIAKLGFTAAVSINYSIFASQPHAERLINIKRGLLTYETMQRHGIVSIPHIYWSGRKDLDAWVEWLSLNPVVTTIAINLQTMRDPKEWERYLSELTYFASQIPARLQVIVTGSSTVDRIQSLVRLFPKMVLSNAHVILSAANRQQLKLDGMKFATPFSDIDKSILAETNVELMTNLMNKMRETSAATETLMFKSRLDSIL